MFWYQFLVMGLGFEVFMFVCSLFKYLFVSCLCRPCGVKPGYFAPIPRLCQTMFLQALMWCGLIYLPGGVVIATISNVVVLLLSFIKASLFKRKPNSGVYLLPSKIQFYTSFALLLITSYAPTAIFMADSTVVECGPFATSKLTGIAPLAMFVERTNNLPTIIREIFSYATNPFVLWIFIITNLAVIFSFSALAKISKKVRDKLSTQLKMESTERVHLLGALGVSGSSVDARGEKLFVSWIEFVLNSQYEVASTADIYNDTKHTRVAHSTPLDTHKLHTHLIKIQRKHPNLLKLVKLTNQQLLHAFQNCGVPENDAHTLLLSFLTFRNERLIHTQGQI